MSTQFWARIPERFKYLTIDKWGRAAVHTLRPTYNDRGGRWANDSGERMELELVSMTADMNAAATLQERPIDPAAAAPVVFPTAPPDPTPAKPPADGTVAYTPLRDVAADMDKYQADLAKQRDSTKVKNIAVVVSVPDEPAPSAEPVGAMEAALKGVTCAYASANALRLVAKLLVTHARLTEDVAVVAALRVLDDSIKSFRTVIDEIGRIERDMDHG